MKREPSDKVKALVHYVYHSATTRAGNALCADLLDYVAGLEAVLTEIVNDDQLAELMREPDTGRRTRLHAGTCPRRPLRARRRWGRQMTATAATSGPITIDLFDHWRWHFAREWEDLGRLVAMREGREHIDRHEPFIPNTTNQWCECFNCRVVAAWEHRYAATVPGTRAGRK